MCLGRVAYTIFISTHGKGMEIWLRELGQELWFFILEIDGVTQLNASIAMLLHGQVPPFQGMFKNSDRDKGSFTSYLPICFNERIRVLTHVSPDLNSIVRDPRFNERTKVGVKGGKLVPIGDGQFGLKSNCTEVRGSAYDPRVRCSLSVACEQEYCLPTVKCACFPEGGWFFNAAYDRYPDPIPKNALFQNMAREPCLTKLADDVNAHWKEDLSDYQFVDLPGANPTSNGFVSVFKYQGQGTITSLMFTVDSNTCSQIEIAIEFDGSKRPQIGPMPMSALFGCYPALRKGCYHNRGWGCVNPKSSLRTDLKNAVHLGSMDGVWHGHRTFEIRLRGRLEKRDVAFTFLPMPFLKEVQVKVRSRIKGGEALARMSFNATVKPGRIDLNQGRLQARWVGSQRDQFCKTGMHDVLRLESGQVGKFVGLLVDMHASPSHMEGDHLVSLHGESTPMYRGTGFEDDFNLPSTAYMFGTDPDKLSFPFYGGMWQQQKGHVALYRLFLLDAMPFYGGFHYWLSLRENGNPTRNACQREFRKLETVAFFYLNSNIRALLSDTLKEFSASAPWKHRLSHPERSQVVFVNSTFTEALSRTPITRKVLSITGPNVQSFTMKLEIPNDGALLRRLFDANEISEKSTDQYGSPLQRAQIEINGTSIGWWQSPNGFNPFERFEEIDLPIPARLTKSKSIDVTVSVPAGGIWTVSEYSVHCIVASR